MVKHSPLFNVNIKDCQQLATPNEVKKEFPLSDKNAKHILKSRKVLQDIIDRKDPRLFMVVGPCSIHDPKAAIEYAKKLKKLAKEVEDTIYIVMRVYFEKPRTTVGWKGLINDPDLDDSFNIEKGIKLARKLLIDISNLGLPTGTEALDPISPQYISELISWSAIGARTTESQTHREMTSGLSMPVGIKNGTDGGIGVAINALQSVEAPHHFLGINEKGKVSRFSTKGNPYAHIVLRGGGGKPNYDANSIKNCEEALKQNNLKANIVVDCSHANSNKDHKLQPGVLKDCIDQMIKGNESIIGFMIESHLNAGNQNLTADKSQLKYGISITDKCVDWKTTETMIKQAHNKLKKLKRFK